MKTQPTSQGRAAPGKAFLFRTILTLLLAGGTLPGLASADWYARDWGYRQAITIVSNRVTGAHTNFPLLVSITNDNPVFDRALPDGADLLFTAADGVTRLSHEKERFDADGKQLAFWVKLPLLNASSNTTLFLYYGSEEAAPASAPQDVWDGDHRMVLHLNESVRPNYDSTAYANHANHTYYAPGSYDAEGRIAGADWFKGNLHDLQAPLSASLQITNAITMSAWLKYDTLVSGAFYGVLQIGTTYIRREDSNRFRCVFTGLSPDNIFSTTVPVSNTWYHVGATYDGTAIRVYVNGVQEASTPSSGLMTPTTDVTRIGRWSNKYHNGILDEVRISSVARSAGWIRTSYDNQSDPAAFLSVGAEKPRPLEGLILMLR